MDTIDSTSNPAATTGSPDLHCVGPCESLFVEPLESFMRLHGWDERVVQRLDLLHLIAVRSASATVLFSETDDALVAGEVLLVPPGMPFGLSCEAGTEGYVVALSTDQTALMESLSVGFAQCVSAGAPSRFSPENTEQTVERFEDLLAVSRAGGCESMLAVHASLCATVASVIQAQARAQRQAAATSSEGALLLVDAFGRLIERDFRSQRPLSDYCEALDVTERALRRATHKCLGQTPLQLIHTRSVREAKRLLRFTNVSVAQVGVALGFDDPAYFNRFFKKAVGESPRAWRIAQIRS